MQKLRIAIVVGTFPTISETFIVNQINSLIEAGHKVQVFAYKKGDTKYIHSSIKTHALLGNVVYFQKKNQSLAKRYFIFLKWIFQNVFNIRWREFFKALNVFKHGKKALKLDVYFASQWFLVGGKFDIIHIHFGQIAQRIAVLKSLGFIKDSKLIASFHGFDLIPNNVENYNTRYATLLQECDAFTVNSVYLEDILKELKVKSRDIYILPVGLDTAYFKKIESEKNVRFFNMLFCGRLIKLKGPDVAIDILIELRRRGNKMVKLTIVGGGRLENKIMDEIKRQQLDNVVSVEGALTQDFVKEKMNSAHILLMPGIHDPITKRAETQGLVLQEAQAMELPVIISDVGGMKYGIIHNETGYIVKEGDVSGFADAIEKLISNEELRANMGKNGREYVVANFDNKVLYDKLISIYRNILNKSKTIH